MRIHLLIAAKRGTSEAGANMQALPAGLPRCYSSEVLPKLSSRFSFRANANPAVLVLLGALKTPSQAVKRT